MDSSYSELHSALNSEQKRHFCKHLTSYLKAISSRLLPLSVVLLVFFTLPFVLANTVAVDIAGDFTVPATIKDRCYAPQPEADPEDAFIVKLLVQTIFHVAIPVAAWLSDTKIGRKTALVLALWTGWLGTLLQTFSQCFQYHSCSTFEMIGKYGFSSLALIFLIPSFAIFYAIVLSYGMDLLVDTSLSVSKHRSFVYWLAWMFFLSGNTSSVSDYLSGMDYSNSRLSIAFLSFIFFSLSLSLYFYVHWGSSTVTNSYTKMWKILKNAVFNCKASDNRRAITFLDKSDRSQLKSIVKRRHGSQYSQGDIANAKTIFRMFLILLVLVPFWVSLESVTAQIKSLVPQFNSGSNSALTTFIIVYVGKCMLLLAIPLMEFFIIPIFPSVEYFLANTLKGLGLSQILLSIAIVTTFTIDIAVHSIAKHVQCFADSRTPADVSGFPLSYLILLIPSVISGVAESISFVCVFEFISRNCPHEMVGMLVGMFWVLYSSSNSISFIFSFTLENWVPASSAVGIFSCTSWFLIAIEIISFVGLFLYVLAARWYTRSLLVDEQTSLETIVEDHFEQQLIRENEENIVADSEF